jgi:hypothetical protein
MRSIALTALLGSFLAATSLMGQSLTEHAAAAAGATIGTAAGKPLGSALAQAFGAVDKSTSAAAGPKTPKPLPAKPVAVAPSAAPTSGTEHPAAVASATGGGGGGNVGGGGGGAVGGAGAVSHRVSGRKELPAAPAPIAAAPIAAIIVPVVVVKEPSAQDVAGIQVGATASDLRAALGAPESVVSIPGDDGHLLEICQYWAKGEPVGTVRLDNGRVVSVQANN